jgi:hypothetical protein
MSDVNTGPGMHEHDELRQLWQQHPSAEADAERAAREIMARVWRFDQQVLWRNFREYAAGLILIVIFAGQIALNNDRIGGAIGLACVGFALMFLWWKHRHVEALDPAADLRVYRRALIQRYDDQIRLLRSVPYWYLLPLFGPGLWNAISQWDRAGLMVLAPLTLLIAVYGFIGWWNVKVAVPRLRMARDRVAMIAAEGER